MKMLILTEWERLWKRKVPWLLLLMIPVMAYVSAVFCKKQNQSFTPDLPQYTVAGNFPVLGLAEMLMTAFNLIVMVLAVMMVTEEYRSGALRMVLIRAKSFQQLLLAKYMVLVSFMFLYIMTYLLVCYGIGWVMFAHPESYPLFYRQEAVTMAGGFIYNLQFYGMAFLTLLAISSVFFLVSVISQTMTTALGISMGYLFSSFAYPNVIQLFQPILGEEKTLKIFLSAIPMIQWEGITLMLADTPRYLGWMLLVLISCFGLFQLLLFLVTRKKDIFI